MAEVYVLLATQTSSVTISYLKHVALRHSLFSNTNLSHLSWKGWSPLDQSNGSNVDFHEHVEKQRDQLNNYQILKEEPY